MSSIRVKSIKLKNYRSFGNEEQEFVFPDENYKKPVAIVGYNNSGKTNLMNAILYGTGQKFVSENTFIITDLHNLNYSNLIAITTDIDASDYTGKNWRGDDETKSVKGEHRLKVELEDNELKSSIKPSFFGAQKHYNVFYINFHKIKEQISTKKTSWGNLTSFLAKHIQKVIENDSSMLAKREKFKRETKGATENVLEGSDLDKFISAITDNYITNLRDNNCNIEFGLPDYEDIFLQMMFKIGLYGEKENLVPLDHFGDGFISMFVMAVIKAIAESNTEDKCLFLFEEPESFLHENHQEYFYKTVLCGLSEKEHQVIYTTHSDRMLDIFDTKGLIRLEFDEEKKQTVKKYNNVGDFSPSNVTYENQQGLEKTINFANYNSFIKSVEPNLNKLLFSKKVVLVEGPNDLIVYKEVIKRKVEEIIKDNPQIQNKKWYADTYLNFHNMAIIPHHGKITALLLMQLCQHIKLDYYVINDWDFEEDFVEELSQLKTEEELRKHSRYTSSDKKGMITVNWKLLNAAKENQIHFNIDKLETVIGYKNNDKCSRKIWNTIKELPDFTESLFPESLEQFLEIKKIDKEICEPEECAAETEKLPF